MGPPPVPQTVPPAPAPAIPFVAPPASRAPVPAPSRFIPDEPFPTLDTTVFAEEAPASPTTGPFIPVTAEESATLSAPALGERPAADSATTVMFQAEDLPWATSPPVHGSTPAPTAGHVPASGSTLAPEPVFVPEHAGSPQREGEGSVFEEVLEEDLEFGPAGFGRGPGGPPRARAGEGVMATPEPTLPPVRPAGDEATTGAFADVELEPEPAAAGPQERPMLLVSAPAPPPASARGAAFGLGREELTFEPEPQPVRAMAPPPARVAPSRASEAPAGQSPESFADVVPAVEPEAPPPAPSEAAAVAVPVDMVEKIAQRVVAQISERVVREIAWEVVPDLAEALIKQEIDRLKAELQKT
jgi:hypothetical protein